MYYIDGLQLLINPFNQLNHCTAILSTGSAYCVTFIYLKIFSNELEISPNRTYLEISPNELEISSNELEISSNRSIWRYLQFNCRYLQLNWRYLQFNCGYVHFNWRYLQFSE